MLMWASGPKRMNAIRTSAEDLAPRHQTGWFPMIDQRPADSDAPARQDLRGPEMPLVGADDHQGRERP